MRPNLYQQYKAQEFDASWLPYLMTHYRTFNLPTEFVAQEPGFFAPLQGRIYNTDLWWVNKVEGQVPFITTRNQWASTMPVLGVVTALEPSSTRWNLGEDIFIVEHYENYGDDGHIQMKLIGYIFVPASGLELVDQFGRKEFSYVNTLQEQETARWANWKCDICGHSDCSSDHCGEGFQ